MFSSENNDEPTQLFSENILKKKEDDPISNFKFVEDAKPIQEVEEEEEEEDELGIIKKSKYRQNGS